MHPVHHVGRGGDQLQVELSLEAIPGDLQVQQAEEAAPEAEAERAGGLRLVDQRRVVEPQPVQGVAQQREVRAVDREQARVHHRLGVAVTAERLGSGLGGIGHGVADPGLADVLHPGDQVADLADAQALGHHRFGRDDADLEQLVGGAGGHHLDLLARADVAVDHPDVGDHAAVDVIDRVEDHRPGLRVGVADRRRDVAADHVEQLLDALAGLGAHPEHVVGVAADDVGDLGGVQVGLGGRQVDLVQHRDDLQVVLQRQVQVGQRLRLDALGGVDQQHRALAGGQAAADLVGEVDVAGGVDHVQRVVGAVQPGLPRHPDVLRLDGDAALALDVHPVQVLGLGLPGIEHAGQPQHLIGQRRLAVVDVGDDREVADACGRGVAGWAGDRGHGLLSVRCRSRLLVRGDRLAAFSHGCAAGRHSRHSPVLGIACHARVAVPSV